MARRTVRSLTPNVAAASRAESGQVSAAPDTSRSARLSAVWPPMMAEACGIGARGTRRAPAGDRRLGPLDRRRNDGGRVAPVPAQDGVQRDVLECVAPQDVAAQRALVAHPDLFQDSRRGGVVREARPFDP